jgi:hypothetical protein
LQALMRRHACRETESAREMAGRQAALAGDRGEADLPGEIRRDQLARPPLLPGRQPAPPWARPAEG